MLQNVPLHCVRCVNVTGFIKSGMSNNLDRKRLGGTSGTEKSGERRKAESPVRYRGSRMDSTKDRYPSHVKECRLKYVASCKL